MLCVNLRSLIIFLDLKIMNLNLQRELANKCIFLFGKLGQGKSRTGNTFSGEISFARNEARLGVTRDIEIFFSEVYRTTIIDSPGILDPGNRTLFHDAFIRSLETRALIPRLPIDVFCIVTKFDEDNRPNFLDVAQNFVKLFGRSGTFSLMIMCIVKEGRENEDFDREEVKNSDGYKYLMEVKREFTQRGNTQEIPFLRWNNLTTNEIQMQNQIFDLRENINRVERNFSLEHTEFAIQLIKNETI